MPISIENIQPKHKEDIHLLLEKINQVDDLGYSLTDEWLDYIIQNTSQSVFIATYDSKLTGIATCMINQMDPSHAIINIVVHPEYRNRGIGSRLHKEVMEFAKASKIENLEASIKKRLEAAVKFAKNRGFTSLLYAWEMTRKVAKENIEITSQDHQGLIVRKATTKDNVLYANMINQVFGDALGSGVLQEILKDPSIMVYILEREGQVLGSLSMQLKTDLSIAYIYDVAIMEKYRGQGLGTYMLNQSMRELEAHHINTVSLTVTGQNKKALSLYKKLGFKEKDADLLGTVAILTKVTL